MKYPQPKFCQKITKVKKWKIMQTNTSKDLLQNHSIFPYFSEKNYQLLIIDPAVADYQLLLDGISPHTFVHILDKHRDGIEQITEILQKAPRLPVSPSPLACPAKAGVSPSPPPSTSSPTAVRVLCTWATAL